MNKITSIKIKYADGSYSGQIPISVLAKNIGWDDDGNSIADAIGDVDINTTGSLQDQINKKVNTTDLSDYVNGQLAGDVVDWLSANVNPVGSVVVVDKTLSIQGAAADSKTVGDKIGTESLELNKHVLKPIMHAVLDSQMQIVFNGPYPAFKTECITSLIPLPKTNKIEYKANGYGGYRAIVFYDKDKNPISSDTNKFSSKQISVPEEAYYFRLGWIGEQEADFKVKFNYLSINAKIEYLMKLMAFNSDIFLYDFEIADFFVFPHTGILVDSGKEIFSSTSNYFATDFILLPDNISFQTIGNYAYTANSMARIAFYDQNKNFISAISSNSKRLIQVEIPENAFYVRFSTHTTIKPQNCVAFTLCSMTNTDQEIIDLIRRALV